MAPEIQEIALGADPEEVAPLEAMHLEMRTTREIRYNILHIRRPVFHAAERALPEIVAERPVLLVVDRNVERLYGAAMREYAGRHLNVAATVVIDGNEAQKSWGQTELICKAAVDCGLGRTGVVIGVGGGVVLDVSGFAASIFRRGIGYLRVPTTLIGQIDVSVGVKQGVNMGRLKNVLGSFYPPLASINDVTFLKTLTTSHIASGFAEILKIAAIADPVLFDLVDQHGAELAASRFQKPAATARVIMTRAEAAMLRELKGNLFETKLQRLVDFGHTFSVAIESDSQYRMPHGHAVGLDILISTGVAVARKLCPPAVLDRLLSVFRRVELPISQRICSPQRLHDSLASVRAHRGGDLNLVVLRDIGQPEFLSAVTVKELTRALALLDVASPSRDRPRL